MHHSKGFKVLLNNKVHVPILDMYLFSTVSNYFQYITEKLTSSTTISAQNANKFFCHTQIIKV